MAKRQVFSKGKRIRITNKLGAYMICGDVKNKNFILIDDVTTTGATLLEARNALVNRGASSVIACTIAH
jgi:predicted amidophosphoribosyltransferase